MEITLSHIGRRFNKEWIFREVSYAFQQPGQYAILGPNGSGKSTFLALMMGALEPSVGAISVRHEGGQIRPEELYAYVSLAAPYLDLIEEFSLEEMVKFHFRFKALAPGISLEEVIELLGLQSSRHKPLKYFSSGMKQRTKLALACCADTPVLLLDEPTSNLDQQGIIWYRKLLQRFAKNKLLLIGSNVPHEYEFCSHQLQIMDFK